jgi:hypothetical protein
VPFTGLAARAAGPENGVRDTASQPGRAARADLALVWNALRSSPIAGVVTTASTLLGVAQLGFPGQLVEIDVTAALLAATC